MTDEPQTYDEAVQLVHRAFCDPEHELVGEWDRSMADALRRNGYAIVTAASVEPEVRGLPTGPRVALCGTDEAPHWHIFGHDALDSVATFQSEADAIAALSAETPTPPKEQ